MITDKTALKYAKKLDGHLAKNCNLYDKCRQCPVTQDKCGAIVAGVKLLIVHLEAINGKG